MEFLLFHANSPFPVFLVFHVEFQWKSRVIEVWEGNGYNRLCSGVAQRSVGRCDTGGSDCRARTRLLKTGSSVGARSRRREGRNDAFRQTARHPRETTGRAAKACRFGRLDTHEGPRRLTRPASSSSERESEPREKGEGEATPRAA